MKYAIGDIHGCLNTLKHLISEISKKDNNPEYIFLGDYINRGNFSFEVIDFLISLSGKNKCSFILGNHDDVFNCIIKNKKYTNLKNFINDTSEISVITWFLQHGLDKTFVSYLKNTNIDISEIDPENTVKIIEHIFKNIPISHKKFFSELAPLKIIDNFFFCHGWFPNQELPRDERFLKQETIESLLWNSFSNNISEKDYSNWDMTGVFGHTPTSKYSGRFFPLTYGNIVLIDTGVCFKGRLSSFCLEEKTFLSVEMDKNDVK